MWRFVYVDLCTHIYIRAYIYLCDCVYECITDRRFSANIFETNCLIHLLRASSDFLEESPTVVENSFPDFYNLCDSSDHHVHTGHKNS